MRSEAVKVVSGILEATEGNRAEGYPEGLEGPAWIWGPQRREWESPGSKADVEGGGACHDIPPQGGMTPGDHSTHSHHKVGPWVSEPQERK